MARRWPTPGHMAADADEHRNGSLMYQLDGVIAAWADKPAGALLVTAGPQAGKTTKFCYQLVPWLLADEPDLRIVVATYSTQWARHLALRIRANASGANVTIGPQALTALSVGSPVQHPQDVLIVDDPVRSTAEADNPRVRERVWQWWRHEALPALVPDGRTAVVMAHWHPDDLAGRLLATESDRWDHLDVA